MMDKPDIAGAYDRGVAHLKRAEYAQAVVAFTQAIGLDPGAANAYIGRALAHRSLGDDPAAARDEQAARQLGGPVKNSWDRLVRQAFRRWRSDLRDPAWARDDPLSRKAYLLWQWTWQIYNGGLPQWVANGYSEWAEDLAQAAEAVGTETARSVAMIVRDVAGIVARWPDAREAMFQMIANRTPPTDREDELFRVLMECEARYDRSGRRPGEFAADVEQWFERLND